ADTAAAWMQRALAAWQAKRVHEPREAELWCRLGDTERSRRRPADAKAAYERAIATATTADSPDALAARRALLEVTPKSGRTLEALEAIVELDPSPDDVLALARGLLKAERIDDAHAVFDLARALNISLGAEDEQFLAQTAPRTMGCDEAYGQGLAE